MGEWWLLKSLEFARRKLRLSIHDFCESSCGGVGLD